MLGNESVFPVSANSSQINEPWGDMLSMPIQPFMPSYLEDQSGQPCNELQPAVMGVGGSDLSTGWRGNDFVNHNLIDTSLPIPNLACTGDQSLYQNTFEQQQSWGLNHIETDTNLLDQDTYKLWLENQNFTCIGGQGLTQNGLEEQPGWIPDQTSSLLYGMSYKDNGFDTSYNPQEDSMQGQSKEHDWYAREAMAMNGTVAHQTGGYSRRPRTQAEDQRLVEIPGGLSQLTPGAQQQNHQSNYHPNLGFPDTVLPNHAYQATYDMSQVSVYCLAGTQQN
jgi:hypothetical protein